MEISLLTGGGWGFPPPNCLKFLKKALNTVNVIKKIVLIKNTLI